ARRAAPGQLHRERDGDRDRRPLQRRAGRVTGDAHRRRRGRHRERAGAGAGTQVPDALSPGGPASVAMHELAPACTFTEPEGWRAPAVAVTVAVTLTSCP